MYFQLPWIIRCLGGEGQGHGITLQFRSLISMISDRWISMQGNCTLSPSSKENNSSTFCLIITVHFFCDSHIYLQWCLTGFFTCVSLMANDPEYLFTSSGAFQKLVPLWIFPRIQSQPLRMLPGTSRQRAIREMQAGPSKPRSTGQSLLCRAT